MKCKCLVISNGKQSISLPITITRPFLIDRSNLTRFRGFLRPFSLSLTIGAAWLFMTWLWDHWGSPSDISELLNRWEVPWQYFPASGVVGRRRGSVGWECTVVFVCKVLEIVDTFREWEGTRDSEGTEALVEIWEHVAAIKRAVDEIIGIWLVLVLKILHLRGQWCKNNTWETSNRLQRIFITKDT